MLLVPDFQFTFIRSDVLRIKHDRIDPRLRQQPLLIPENNRAEPRDSRPHIINHPLYMFRKTFEIHLHLRTRPYDTHRSTEYIQYLRQFIDLRLPQKTAERQYTRIIPGGQAACPHIGGVLQHGGELKNRKHPVPVPNPFLQIPYLMFSRTPQNQHTGQ